MPDVAAVYTVDVRTHASPDGIRRRSGAAFQARPLGRPPCGRCWQRRSRRSSSAARARCSRAQSPHRGRPETRDARRRRSQGLARRCPHAGEQHAWNQIALVTGASRASGVPSRSTWPAWRARHRYCHERVRRAGRRRIPWRRADRWPGCRAGRLLTPPSVEACFKGPRRPRGHADDPRQQCGRHTRRTVDAHERR